MEINDNYGNYPGEASDISINISDVIAVIESTDPSALEMFQNSATSAMETSNSSVDPHVVIVEHPAPKALRFRYECEGRSAGSIPGRNSTPDNKTFPTIQVMNYVGRAVVVVSCVTKDFPHKPHPHNLVGREGCKKGVCTLEINTDDMKMVFSNLGIQCVKRKDIEEALRIREEIRVDPFRTGYAHHSQPSSIDLNAVRLCFQVFLEGPQKGKFTSPLKPVVSDTIYDKKSMSDLVITKLSHCNAVCNGGQEMILLCEKVAKEDIAIRFYEETVDGWEGFGEFQHSQVHKQVAISFKTPKFKFIDISEPVRVKVQLRRPSDGATSEPLDFEMLPLNEEDQYRKLGRKRQRSSDDASTLNDFIKKSPGHDGQFLQRNFQVIKDQPVKLEPREQNISPYDFTGAYRDPVQATPSPQPPPQALSPPMFQITYNNNGNIGTILQNQLQGTLPSMQNNFQQQPQSSQVYTPNIQSASPLHFNNNGNQGLWTNEMGNGDPVLGRQQFYNGLVQNTSPLFSDFVTPSPSITQNFGVNMEPTSSNLMDLDILNNLSGDLKGLSVSDLLK